MSLRMLSLHMSSVRVYAREGAAAYPTCLTPSPQMYLGNVLPNVGALDRSAASWPGALHPRFPS